MLWKKLIWAGLIWSVAAYTAAGAPFVPGEVIIKVKPSPAAASFSLSSVSLPASVQDINQRIGAVRTDKVFKAARRGLGVSQIAASPLDNIYKIKLPPGKSVEEVLALLKADPDVEFAEPNYLNEIARVPNDPHYTDNTQWYLNQPGGNNIAAPQAWDITTGSPTVTIAVIDTGVDWNHPDLANNIWNNLNELPNNGIDDDGNGYIDDVRGWDFVNVDQFGSAAPANGEDGYTPDNDPMDYHGHGTHVAGIASAVTDNGVGIAGVGWDTKIMPVRAGYKGVDSGGWLENDDAAAAIQYAADNGANIINVSWGSTASSVLIRTIVDYAAGKGALIMAAAGNSDSPSYYYPAAFSNVLAVGATSGSDTKASFSNYGSWVGIFAPGVNIYSTKYNDSYGYDSGTSMAAPLVAGVAALVLSMNPSTTSTEVAARIKNTADNIDALNPAYAGQLGSGRVNAYRAVQPPSIVFNPFAQNISSSLTPTLSGQITDLASNIIKVEFRLNGGSWVSATLTGTGTQVAWSYTTEKLSDGTYLVEVRATNSLNFTSALSGYTFYIDAEANLPTTIGIGSSTQNAAGLTSMLLNSATAITGTIQPTEHVAAVAKGAGGESYNLAATVNSNGGFTISSSTLAEGTYTLDITISNYDYSDTKYLVQGLSMVIDNTVPMVKDFCMDTMKIFTGDIIPPHPTITATIEDTHGIQGSSISLVIDGTAIANSALTLSPTTATATSYSITYEILPANALAAGTHSVSLSGTDLAGNVGSHEATNLTVHGGEAQIKGVALNYPNPFHPAKGESTVIGYDMTVAARISIYIYDLSGELVWKRNYEADTMGGKADYNEVTWNGQNDFGEIAGNGIYFYRITSGTKILAKGRITVID